MIRKVHESFLDAEALTLSGGKYAADINSRNNQQAAIVTYAGFQYAVYYDRNRHVCLARRKLPVHGRGEVDMERKKGVGSDSFCGKAGKDRSIGSFTFPTGSLWTPSGCLNR